MSNITTPGRLLVRKAIPSEYRDSELILDGKGAKSFFGDLATKNQEEYVDVLARLMDIAKDASTEYGEQASISLRDLKISPEMQLMREKLRKDISKIAQDPRLSMEKKNEKILDYMKDRITTMHDMIRESSLKDKNAFANAIKYGYRGSAPQFTQIVFGDLLVADHKGKPVPVPGLHGYGEGVLPIEYWGGSYGSRKGFCLDENTRIRSASGKALKLAELDPDTVQVYGVSLEGHARPVNILRVIHNGKKPVFTYQFTYVNDGGDAPEETLTLNCSKEHKILTLEKDGYSFIKLPMKDVEEWKTLVPWVDRSNKLRMCKLSSKLFLGYRQTFDIEVDHPDHLFILDKGFIVSNSDVQFSTAQTGYFGKRLSLMTHRIRVTGQDCGAENVGLPVTGEDPDNIGAVLARQVGPYKPNTIISKDMLPALQGKTIHIRSAATCQQPEGVCQKCSGIREMGKFPDIGDFVGVHAARVVSEPLTQLGLKSKHTGGAFGSNQELSGFEEIEQFADVPENFIGKSILAPRDGKVSKIVTAPQGGHYVFVDGEQLYIPVDRALGVKVGDEVEAGDSLSDGTPNPSELASYKGIGEGRKYFTDKFYELLKSNDVPVHRRNVEALARGFFDKVRVTSTDGVAGYEIGEKVPYSDIQREYVPRADSQISRVSRSLNGKFLERPVLHYSIGTRLTPKVIKTLQQSGVDSVVSHVQPPGFEPEVTRLMDIPSTDPDWKVRMAGFGLKSSFLDAATHGSSSPKKPVSYIPGLMDVSQL